VKSDQNHDRNEESHGYHVAPGLRISQQGVTLGRPGVFHHTVEFNSGDEPDVPVLKFESPVHQFVKRLEGLLSEKFSDPADLWKIAMRHASQGEFDRAAKLMRKVLRKDHSCADALLALYAWQEPDEDLIRKLHYHAGHLGDHQSEDGLELHAWYQPLLYTSVPLQSADDAHRAYAAQRIRNRESASNILTLCDPHHPHTVLLRAQISMNNGFYDHVLQLLDCCDDYKEMSCEANLLRAEAFECLGRLEEAEAAYTTVSDTGGPEGAVRFAHYRLACIAQQTGRTTLAAVTFKQLYDENPLYMDVSQRLYGSPTQDEFDHAFMKIVGAFEVDADDDSILDNHHWRTWSQ
jgi:tetratricopeptide (TPR) repeat protein